MPALKNEPASNEYKKVVISRGKGSCLRYITIVADRKQISAVIDTASEKCLVSGSTASSLGLEPKCTNIQLYNASDEKIGTSGEVLIDFSIHDSLFSYSFIVVPGFSFDMLIGADFMSDVGSCIDFKNEIAYFGGTDVSMHKDTNKHILHNSKELRLEPRTLNVVTCVASVDDGVYYMRDKFLNNGVCFLPGIAEVTDSVASVCLINRCDRPVVLNVGSKIATMKSVDCEDTNVSDVSIAKLRDRQSPVFQSNNVVDQCVGDLEFKLGSNLSNDEMKKICSVLKENSHVFSKNDEDLGECTVGTHKIMLKDSSRTVKRAPYRMSPKEREVVDSIVQSMVKIGIVRPSKSQHASPVVLVPKPNSKWRLCVDYRELNRLSKVDTYPLPRIDDVLDCFSGCRYFSVIDFTSGFWQIPLDEDSISLSAFIVPGGLYEFLRMPFGLAGAPATCQRVVDNVIADLKWRSAITYMDDTVIFSKTFEEHVYTIDSVLKRFVDAGLKANAKKCVFASNYITYLGYVISDLGCSVNPKKVEIIRNMPAPKTVSELRRFIGMCSYFRRFIPGFSTAAASLFNLMKNGVAYEWQAEHEQAFRKLKELLCKYPVMHHFEPNAHSYLHCDASNEGLGAVLMQKDAEGKEHPISYISRSLTSPEKNYTVTEKECLSVKWAIEKFRPYLIYKPFTVVTDHHSLCWLMKLRDANSRLTRWSLALQVYQFDIVYKKGSAHKCPDCLSRLVENKSKKTVNVVKLSEVCENIEIEQRKDKYCKKIIASLDNNENTNATQRKYIRKRFFLSDNVLYRKTYLPTGVVNTLVIPQALVQKLLIDMHCGSFGGHFAVLRTFERARSRYFWPAMFSSIREYIKACPSCQFRSNSSKPCTVDMQTVPTGAPFESISMDLAGPWPRDGKGRTHAIIVVCDFTGYCEIGALRKESSDDVVEFLEEKLIMRHGCPRVVRSDRGSQFISKTTKQYFQSRNIRSITTTSYHPEGNGLAERTVRTLKSYLIHYLNTDRRNWSALLPYATFTMNTSHSISRGTSPFFLLYGRNPLLPTDINLNRKQFMHDADCEVTGLPIWMQRSMSAREIAKAVIREAREPVLMRFGEQAKPISYDKGQLILLQVPKPLQKGKTYKFEGPYRIISKISDVNYEIQALESNSRGDLWSDIVHIKRIKPFVIPRYYLDYNKKSSDEHDSNNDDSDDDGEIDDQHDLDYEPN